MLCTWLHSMVVFAPNNIVEVVQKAPNSKPEQIKLQ